MPNLPNVHSVKVKAKTHQVVQKKLSSTQRGYTYKWKKFRLQFLRQNPLCVKCHENGIIKEANEVDHIVPHEGNMEIFWQPGNHQALCKNCHSEKTVMENNFQPNQYHMTPEWMPVFQKKLYLICGRPGSGKTTYVNNHKGKYDLVLDLDDICQEIGKKIYELTGPERAKVIRLRNDRLLRYAKSETDHNVCWLIAVAGTVKHREFWESRGAEIIIIDTPADVCENRVRKREFPKEFEENSINSIRKWA